MLSLSARRAFPDFKVLQTSGPSSGGCACLPVCWAGPQGRQDLSPTLALDLCIPAQCVVPLPTTVTSLREETPLPTPVKLHGPWDLPVA